jgi:hypothetical protein
MKFSSCFGKIIQGIMLAFLIFYSLNALSAEKWSYEQTRDTLSNLTYSFAKSPLPPRGLYDNIRMEIVCKNNTLQVVVDAYSFITSQGRPFDFEYQIDNSTPISIQMKTFNDSKRRGYTEDQAKRIANDMLTGQSVFIRVNTMLGAVLSGKISLENAQASIKQVFSDCGLMPSETGASQETGYSLADFEREFNKLTHERQQQVLNEIKKIISEIP